MWSALIQLSDIPRKEKEREKILSPSLTQTLDWHRASGTIQTPETSSSLRANPFPEVTDLFCRLPLLALLYRLEVVNLGDLMRWWVRQGVKLFFAKLSSSKFSRSVSCAFNLEPIFCLVRTQAGSCGSWPSSLCKRLPRRQFSVLLACVVDLQIPVRKTTQAPKCANRAYLLFWRGDIPYLRNKFLQHKIAKVRKTKPMKKKRKLLWRQDPEIFGCFCVAAHLIKFKKFERECLPSCSGMLAAFPFSTKHKIYITVNLQLTVSRHVD